MKHVLRQARLSHGALAENERHGFAARHALCIYRSNAVYSFIPKNACTTLRYSLALDNGAIAGPEDFGWIHHNNWTFSASLRDLVTAHSSFVLLRCPFARLASFYLDKIVGQLPPAPRLLPLLPHIASLRHLSFRQFALAMLDPAIRGHNNHWCPQSDFLVYETYSAYFCLERFAEASEGIERMTGLKVQDARALGRHDLSRFTRDGSARYCDVPAQEITALKARNLVPATEALYDDEIVAAVCQAYAEDLALYRDCFGSGTLTFP